MGCPFDINRLCSIKSALVLAHRRAKQAILSIKDAIDRFSIIPPEGML